MPQRATYNVLSTIKATDTVWDDTHEAEIEGHASLLLFTVRGASADFLATAPDHAGISHGQVEGVVTPIADATSSQLVDPIDALTDDAGIDDQPTTVSFDVDGGVYERFQDLITPFRVIIETEQMLVTAVVDGATEDTWTVIRAINGTSIAAHATDVAILHLVGPETEEFRVDDASAFAVNDVLKVATGGAERMLVTARNETTDIIAVKRGIWGTTPVDIADNANLWDVIDDVKVLAAIASVSTELRVLGHGDKYPEGDFTDNRIPLLAADFA